MKEKVKEFLGIEVDKKSIIKFILKEEEIEEEVNCFLDVKNLLEKKYNNLPKQKLEEEYLTYKYREVSLKPINSENIAIACLAGLAVLISALSLLFATNDVVLYNAEISLIISVIVIFISICMTVTIYIILVGYRMMEKSKKLVQCKIVIDVLEAIGKPCKEVLKFTEK